MIEITTVCLFIPWREVCGQTVRDRPRAQQHCGGPALFFLSCPQGLHKKKNNKRKLKKMALSVGEETETRPDLLHKGWEGLGEPITGAEAGVPTSSLVGRGRGSKPNVERFAAVAATTGGPLERSCSFQKRNTAKGQQEINLAFCPPPLSQGCLSTSSLNNPTESQRVRKP